MENTRFMVDTLGSPERENPIARMGDFEFVDEGQRLLYNPHTSALPLGETDGEAPPASFELAGPRRQIYFDPGQVRAAIVTCGGLCPGLNGVIRSLVMELWHRYGCPQIYGVRYGYHGLGPESPDLVPLRPSDVSEIHSQGGTILGSSRGTPGVEAIVDTLERRGINMLFTIGGDGTMRGAAAIWEAAQVRRLKLSIIGIPKTIDNDIPYVRRSFGFETAVGVATGSIHSAHVEARGTHNGIGLVKLMGRHSGYIAASAALAAGHANFCLIPEVPFGLEGDNGLLALLDRRLAERQHAVLVVAEGAGQEFFEGAETGYDASGNAKLGDIGGYLRRRLEQHFDARGIGIALKYIDPSYMIRSAPANPNDQLFCARMAQNAVHAGMAGKSGMLVGYWLGRVTHVPMRALEQRQNHINPKGELWFNVLETTGQPSRIGDPAKAPHLAASAAGV